jgi:hypothetical protein
MSSQLQTIIALTLVALAAACLAWRWFGKRKNAGCGSDCGCDAQKITSSLKRR